MMAGGQMAKRIKFNLCDVLRGHVEKRRKELGQERVCKQVMAGGGSTTPIEKKA